MPEKASGELTAAWCELRNKARIYWLVRYQRRPLPRDATLGALVARVYEREAETAPFSLERLGIDFVNAAWRRAGPPRGLLVADATLPEESLALLHSGLGMAASRRLLRPLAAGAPAAELAARMTEFLELVHANARPEFAPVAIEAAGIMVRMFHPRLKDRVARWMRDARPDLEGFYWHGVGRATYFLPASSVPRPGALRRSLAVCRREPPDASTRLDALAGLAFAVAMINWHQPWLIERLFRLLVEHPDATRWARSAAAGQARQAAGAERFGGTGDAARCGGADETEAFASGVAACIIARQLTLALPAGPPVLSYTPPEAAGPRLAELWESRVRLPCAAALAHALPHLAARRELGRLARFVPLAPLLAAAQAPLLAAAQPPPAAAAAAASGRS
jgi:hypothetical protein